jgi:hypothetical protein
VRAEIVEGRMGIEASAPLRRLGEGRWLNLRAVLEQTEDVPRLAALRIGSLPLPPALAEWALPRLLERAGLLAQGELALDLITRVGFTRGGQMVIAFAWPRDLERRLASSLMSPEEQLRMKAHAERLAQLTHDLARGPGPRRPVSLVALLSPMAAFAEERSRAGGDAARENRAALLALTSYVNGRGLHALVPDARRWPKLAPLRVELAGRDDTVKHFLVSAVLAMEGGSPLADVVGLYKEVKDARGGSGFSFNDLAADRAGTRFGQVLLRQPQRLQQALAAGFTEADLLPSIADLPENMQDPEFVRRFGGVDAPAYKRLMAEIERRLDGVPLINGRPARGA